MTFTVSQPFLSGLTFVPSGAHTEPMNETEIEEYRIHGSRITAVRSKFEKLTKRAAKLGVPAPVFTIVREEAIALRWKDSEYGEGAWIRCEEEQAERHEREYIATVTGDPVQLPGGWKLAGTIQHTVAGNAIRLVPNIDIDSTPFRTGSAVCDHCNTDRRRIDTYLVVNDEGTIKRVGSNCIRDFLGYGDPSLLVAFASSVLDALGELGEEHEPSGSADRSVVHMADLLAETVAAIDAHGWLSKGNARENEETPTASHAIDNLFATCECHERNCFKSHRSNARPTEEQKAEADVVLTYCRDKFSAPDFSGSDYEWNLSVSLTREWVEMREAGIVASAVFYYRREMEKEINLRARAEKSTSEHQGELKERLRDLRLQVTFVREFGDVDDLYGTRTLVKFQDAAGNIFEWWSSQAFSPDQGSWWNVTGTVTKHNEFKGVKATTLNRCKVEVEEAEEA